MKKVILLSVAILLCSVTARSQYIPPKADHHVHIRSESATIAGEEWQDAIPLDINEEYKARTLSASQIIEDLEKADIDKALLLSSAYYFTAPELEYDNEQHRVQKENNWTAHEAEKSESLAFACSLSPLSDYAIEEIQRCANKLGADAIKLHFFYSDVKIKNSTHLKKIRKVVKEADKHGLYIVIHPETRTPYMGDQERSFGARSIEKLIKALSPYPQKSTIQFAHLAIGSTPSEDDLREIEKLADILDKYDPKAKRFLLDTSYVVVPPGLVPDDKKEVLEFINNTNPRGGKALDIIGPERLVFGSDALDPGQIVLHMQAVAEESELDYETINQIFDNIAPVF